MMGKRKKEQQANDPRSDLYEMADWYKGAKGTLSQRAEEFGEEEEAIRDLANNWPVIDGEISKLYPDIRNSFSAYTSGSIPWFRSRDPTDPAQWWNENPTAISRYIFSSTGTATTIMVTSPSPQPELKKISEIFQKPIREKQGRQFAAAELGKISPELRNKFEDAWRIWYTGDENSINNALLAMRESLDHTIKYLSKAGQPFRGSLSEQRKKRVEWIAANLVKDPLKRAGLVEAQRLYSKLSELGKKRGPVPPKVARELLIQTQDFIRLLLDACRPATGLSSESQSL